MLVRQTVAMFSSKFLPKAEELWEMLRVGALRKVMKGSAVDNLDLFGAALVLEVQIPPKFQPIQILPIHHASQRPPERFGDMAGHERIKLAGNPKQVTRDAFHVAMSLDSGKGQRESFPLKLEDDPAIPLV